MCVSELVQLHDVAEAIKAKGGRMLAICTDAPADSKRVIDRYKLNFSILSDEKGEAIRRYGLLHAGGSPKGGDIAVPAHVLIDSSGRIIWRRKSEKIQDRPDPAEVRAAIEALK